MIGGYKIIDLNGIELSSSSVKVPGIYSRIESNTSKPFLMRNYKRSGVERQPFFSTVVATDATGGFFMSVYAGTVNAVTLLVAQNDYVRIQTASYGEAAGSPTSEEPTASM